MDNLYERAFLCNAEEKPPPENFHVALDLNFMVKKILAFYKSVLT